MVRRILSIDGGGIRGVFPAALLAELEEDVGQPLWRYFDLIAGTSTGGLIAIGLALGVPARDILRLYESHGPEIFGQSRTGLMGWVDRQGRKARFYGWGPKHTSGPMQAALTDILGDRRLGEARTRLLIPAWHHQTGKVHLFKTAHHERFRTGYKELARDVGMSTAAPPVFMKAHVSARGVSLVDGGIWANNPAGIAVVEAIGTLGWEAGELRVLSIGCLEDVHAMREATGALRLARGGKLQALFMAGQSQGALGIAHVLTGEVGGSEHRAIWRVSQPVPANLFSMDDTRKIAELKSRALAEAREQKPKLRPVFFSEPAEEFVPVHQLT